MPLILEEAEVKAIKAALDNGALRFFGRGIGSSVMQKLLTLLDENPDCKIWVIMTKEEYENMSKKD